MANSNNAAAGASGGIGILGFLGLIFITLKLCGVINWSWLWVLAPFWLPLTIVLSVLLGLGIVWVMIIIMIAFIEAVTKDKKSKPKFTIG